MQGRPSPQRDGASARQEDPQSELDAVLDLQQTYGNQAVVQLLAAGGPGAQPPVVPNRARAGIGNRALAVLLAGVAQREPAGASAKATTKSPAAGSKPGAQNKAKPKDSTSEFNSYAALVNAFQELTMAAINEHGVGLGKVSFGHDLNPGHRQLLNQVRSVLVRQTQNEPAAHRSAGAMWPGLAAKLMKTVDEARALGLKPSVLAAVTDDIALIGREYIKAKPGKGEPEVVTTDDLKEAYNGINNLVWAFHFEAEASDGIIREEVPRRKDLPVSKGVIDLNAGIRARLKAVTLGSELTGRHRKLLERLRSAFTTARSEAPGSAYAGLRQWQAIRGDLAYVLDSAKSMAQVDTSELLPIFNSIDGMLTAHYAAVHKENLVSALSEAPQREQDAIEKTISRMGPTAAAAVEESRVVRKFKEALNVIEHHLNPSPDRPGEYIIAKPDGTLMRVRADQALQLKEAARTQVKAYMASIVKEMVQAWDTYDQIQRGTGSTRLHVLETLGGADDPGDQSSAKNAVIKVRDDLVYKLADSGQLVAAFEETLRQKVDVERRARAVRDYDSDTDKGFNRLATTAAVVTVALTALVPVAGEAALAVEGTSALAVAGTAVATGAGATAIAETARQAAFDDHMDIGKIGKTAWSGTVIAAGAVAPAATRQISNFIAPAATGTELAGANMVAGTVVGGVQSKAGGGSALQGGAAGGLGSLAGTLTNALAPLGKAPVTNIALQGAAGGGIAYATDQDVAGGVVGGLAGGVASKVGAPKAGATTGETSATPATPASPAAPAAPVPGESQIGAAHLPGLPSGAPQAAATQPLVVAGASGAGLPQQGIGTPMPGPAQAPAAAPLATAGSKPGGAKPASVVPTNEEADIAFGNLEAGTGPKQDPTNLYSVSGGALTDARFSGAGGSELDVRNVSKVRAQEGPAPLMPGDQPGAVIEGKRPPETWLMEPDRANITDQKEAAQTDFKPKRTSDDRGFETRNAQVVAGPGGTGVRTPSRAFGADRVVGGAQGATLDPATGQWVPGDAAHVPAPNKLGQPGKFVPKTQDEWNAWEQTNGKLSDEERYALWFYSDDLSGQINPALRGQKAGQFVTDPIARQAAASDLDRAMQPVPFDTVVHRKASISDFHDLRVSDPAELVNLKGKTYAHQGYTSTAVAPGKWSGELEIVIQVPKGTRGRYLAGAPGSEPTNPLKPSPGAPLASMPGEMEFLLERGTSFTIEDARQDASSGRWTIEVRVAAQGEKAQPLTNPVPLPGTPSKP